MVTRARDSGPRARELPHTADLALEVEAPTLPLLFERAGLGVLELMADLRAVEVRERRRLAIEGTGLEELLRDWLQALVVAFQMDRFAIGELEVERVDDRRVAGFAGGEPVDPARHAIHTEIKGVTYHALAVERAGDGWRARFVVDV
jgi:SHS2 domain-containing protein